MTGTIKLKDSNAITAAKIKMLAPIIEQICLKVGAQDTVVFTDKWDEQCCQYEHSNYIAWYTACVIVGVI